MGKNENISHLDVNQMSVKMFDSENDAQRVVIVGQDIDMSGVTKALEEGLKNLQLPEIKVDLPKFEAQVGSQEVKVIEIEKPIIVEKLVYKEIEVPLLVKEYSIKEIEKPILVEKTEYKEIEKPIIIYQQDKVVTPKMLYVFLGLQIVLTLIAILK